MSWWNPATWGQAKMEAKAISLNPNDKEKVARHLGRLANLYRHSGVLTEEMQTEIKQRQAALLLAGFDLVTSAEDADALREKL